MSLLAGGTAKRLINRHGRDGTLRNFTETGKNDLGKPEYSENDTTVKMVQKLSRENLDNESSGQRALARSEFWILTSETVYGSNNNQGKRASRLIFDNQKWSVVITEKDGNFYRVVAETDE